MLDEKPISEGYRHHALDEVDSTNARALELAKDGAESRLWVSAQVQHKGRGSRGRDWVSERGNLYASLLLKLDIKPRLLATMTFAISLAVYECLAKIADPKLLSLKWPNDVLLEKAKVSGILLESHTICKEAVQIIGIGINNKHNPPYTNHKATNLHDNGVEIKPMDLLADLSVEIDKWLNIWQADTDFKEIRQQWLKRASGLGEHILVKLPKSELSGTFEDLDAHGLLVLKTADGKLHKISTADIFLFDPKSI